MGMVTRAVAMAGLVLSGALATVSTGSPASAAAVPCTQTFGSNGGASQQGATVFVPANAWLTSGARVTDVDVRIVGQGYGSSQGPLTITVTHDQRADIYRSQFQDNYYPSWDLTFDDEAGSRPAPGQTTGRVRPTFPLSIHDLSLAGGAWRVDFEQTSGGFDLIAVELTITSDDCDSDGDGVAETADNCPTTANADQTDWDGDRIGNACDTTPGVAPSPPSTTPPPPEVVPPPPGCTASCAYASTLGLRHQKARHRLTGKVDSVALGCRAGVEVTIWRKKSGTDRKLVVVTTRPTGTFRTKAPRRAGRYYATVGSAAQPLCGGAESRVVRIRRR